MNNTKSINFKEIQQDNRSSLVKEVKSYFLPREDFNLLNGQTELSLYEKGYRAYTLEVSESDPNSMVLRLFKDDFNAKVFSERLWDTYNEPSSLHYLRTYNSELTPEKFSRKRMNSLRGAIKRMEKQIDELSKKVNMFKREMDVYESSLE